jgi:diguanylate cyclase (GGDEF)-like protein
MHVPADVLLVDAHEPTRERLRFMLESAGYAVTTAGNGHEALACLRQRFIPLLIADVTMPVMGGLELCRQLRQVPLPGYLYTILWSHRDDPEEIVSGLDAGADEYISKHATRSEVLARLMVGRRHVGWDQALRRAALKNELLANTDDLTGSANRRYLLRGLDQAVTRARIERQWLSILMCDLDHFKVVNDRWGHAAGDEILRAFVARVSGLVSEQHGWIGRYGGEEFAIVLPATPPHSACHIADLILRAVAAQPLVCSAGPVPVTISIGAGGLSPAELRAGASVTDLLELADQCLYASKRSGRNTVTTRRLHAAARQAEASAQ